MKINATRSIKNSTNTKTNKKTLPKNQNLINFNGNLLKIVNRFANELTQGIDKKLSSNQLGETALKIKHKTNIDISKNQFENMQLKTKTMVNQIKNSIQNTFKKHSNNSEFSPEEKPLVAWIHKGPRDVSVSNGQRAAIAEQQALLESGKITQSEYNSRVHTIDSYFTKAKDLPSDVSSSDIIKNQPVFHGSAPQEAAPPPGHNARLAGAASTPQQSMQYNMGHLTTEQLIIYKEFIEKRKKKFWD